MASSLCAPTACGFDVNSFHLVQNLGHVTIANEFSDRLRTLADNAHHSRPDERPTVNINVHGASVSQTVEPETRWGGLRIGARRISNLMFRIYVAAKKQEPLWRVRRYGTTGGDLYAYYVL